MSAEKFPAARPPESTAAWPTTSWEEIELCVARGRRERSDAIAAAFVGAWRALRRFVGGELEAQTRYRVQGKVRS